MSNVIIDYRERRHFEGLIPGAEFANLDVGDFHILRDGALLMVVERKTLTDLASSLKDGRYTEQKARMLAKVDGDTRRLAIVVEGVFPFSGDEPVDGIPARALRTLVINLMHRDGVAVYTVRDCRETADLVAHMAEKAEPGASLHTHPYTASVKTKKSDNLTPRTTAVLQLCVVPRVSARIAEAVLTELGCETLGDMCATLNGYEGDVVKKLAEIKVNGRRVGDVTARRIFETLHMRSNGG